MTKLPHHPLRDTLTKEDWKRIQEVIDNKLDITLATLEEINAANDVFYDAIAGSQQTHYGVTTFQ
jgi:histidine ammonia-lyase|tara:strand:- start:448 stop:642 length:195 start_codon:yes stop_codon:yes gene_type:complete